MSWSSSASLSADVPVPLSLAAPTAMPMPIYMPIADLLPADMDMPVPPPASMQHLTSAETMEIVSQATAFLVKLWRILANPAFSHAISWTADQEFAIMDVKALERDVLPWHFRSTHYASFQRQLNYFSFAKVGKNSYSHPHFDRKNPSTVLLIKRKTNTGNLTKKRKAQALKQQMQQTQALPMLEIVPCPKKLMRNVDHPVVVKEEVPRPRIMSPVNTSATSLISVKPRAKKLTPKPRTPMTPFFECLKMCDKLVKAHPNTDFTSKVGTFSKDALSFPFLIGAEDLAEFEKGLDWACGIDEMLAVVRA